MRTLTCILRCESLTQSLLPAQTLLILTRMYGILDTPAYTAATIKCMRILIARNEAVYGPISTDTSSVTGQLASAYLNQSHWCTEPSADGSVEGSVEDYEGAMRYALLAADWARRAFHIKAVLYGRSHEVSSGVLQAVIKPLPHPDLE